MTATQNRNELKASGKKTTATVKGVKPAIKTGRNAKIKHQIIVGNRVVEGTGRVVAGIKPGEGFNRFKLKIVKANPNERIKIVREGVPTYILESTWKYFDMPRAEFVSLLGTSTATVERKIKAGILLGHTETERLERIALITDEAEKVFGEANSARSWLTEFNIVFGATPLSMMDTETGVGEVRKVLSAIAYGGAV